MTDRPIPFTGPMMRAILEGRKTQTRRVLKTQPDPRAPIGGAALVGGVWCWLDGRDGSIHSTFKVPHDVGDRLWVKEGFSYWADRASAEAAQAIEGTDDPCVWRADYRDGTSSIPIGGSGWRSPRFMPRRFSRITLTVTDVRVQRLQEISEDDAIAEGSFLGRCKCMPPQKSGDAVNRLFSQTWCHLCGDEFHALWNSINGPEAWDSNPWVVAYTFTTEKRNIDQ